MHTPLFALWSCTSPLGHVNRQSETCTILPLSTTVMMSVTSEV